MYSVFVGECDVFGEVYLFGVVKRLVINKSHALDDESLLVAYSHLFINETKRHSVHIRTQERDHCLHIKLLFAVKRNGCSASDPLARRSPCQQYQFLFICRVIVLLSVLVVYRYERNSYLS
jgi:hypothetical protein